MPTSVDYSRTAATEFNREALSALSLLLVGAGALGNEVFRLLGLLGLGSITIVDPDTIEASNLTRSVFFRESGALEKARALYEAGVRFFPDTDWHYEVSEIADVSYSDIAGCDLIIGCVDNDLARLEISAIANRLGLPYVDGGLGGSDYWKGRVSLFPPGGACFGCKLPEARRRELLSAAYSGGNSCWSSREQETLSSTPILSTAISSLLVDSALSCLLPSREERPQLSVTDELKLSGVPTLTQTRQYVSASCPFHRSKVTLVEAPAGNTSAYDLLRRCNGKFIELDWPICVSASCVGCGFEWRPMLRSALLRKRGFCPACQSSKVIHGDCLHVIEIHSQWATLPLTELGLPARHQYVIV